MWRLLDWFWARLSDLGLYGKHAKLVFLGLDNAGKTTLLQLLVNDQVGVFMPTQKPTAEAFVMGGVTFTSHDLGGHEVARRLWFEYSVDAQGLIFLIDASDKARLPEAMDELTRLRSDPQLDMIPILVLANKIDLQDSMGERALRLFFDIPPPESYLQPVDNQRTAPVALYLCSLVKRQGYKEGIQWLAQFI